MAWEVAAFGGPGEPVFTGGNAAVWRRRRRCPPAGAKGDRTPMVSCPLLTPLTFLWTRLPSVARLNARGPQGRLVLQGYTLDRSRAFRSGELPLCTGWPRTVMRGKPRKLTSGPDSVPKSARRTEPSPRFPRFAARPKGVAAQRRVWGSQEGAREPSGALAPFCLRRQTAAMPSLPIGSQSRLRRQAAGTAEDFTIANRIIIPRV